MRCRTSKAALRLALLVSLALSGCVWESDYDALAVKNRQQEQQLAAAAAEHQRLQQQISVNQQEIAAKQQEIVANQRQMADDKVQINRLIGAIKYTVNSDLLFPSGSWQMSPAGQQIIAKMASQLASGQRLKLVVNGFTDNAPIGPDLRRQGISTNQELSQKRAENVMEFLVAQGVRRELVIAQGFGEDDPIAPNDTPQGRANNRRVEITVAGS
jgi:chemotaxis protein MotB